MNERGYTLLDALMSLGVAGIILSLTLTVFTSLSRITLTLSGHNTGIMKSMKVSAVVTTALGTLERNRLPFAAQITPGRSLTLPHGGDHPLSSLRGSTAPRGSSDVISLIDLAHRHRGRIVTSTFSGSAIEAEICDIQSTIPTSEFKSFVLYTIEGARQVVGEFAYRSTSCISITGVSIRGVVSPHAEITSPPIAFVPIEREYSLFVDGGSNLRIASHVGHRITENQPIVGGIEFISVVRSQHTDGATTFTANVKPTVGSVVTTFMVPGLSQRMLWNEVLP